MHEWVRNVARLEGEADALDDHETTRSNSETVLDKFLCFCMEPFFGYMRRKIIAVAHNFPRASTCYIAIMSFVHNKSNSSSVRRIIRAPVPTETVTITLEFSLNELVRWVYKPLRHGASPLLLVLRLRDVSEGSGVRRTRRTLRPTRRIIILWMRSFSSKA